MLPVFYFILFFLEKFENLSNFLFGMKRVTGWTQVPNLVKLGNDLLRQLLTVSTLFLYRRYKAVGDSGEQLQIGSEDPIEKENSLIVKKKRLRPPTKVVKKLNVGNRNQFRPKGNAGGLTSTGEVRYRKPVRPQKQAIPAVGEQVGALLKEVDGDTQLVIVLLGGRGESVGRGEIENGRYYLRPRTDT